MANGQSGGGGFNQPNMQTQQVQPNAQPQPAGGGYQPGANYWAQKNQALNPTGASSFGYNVNKMQPGWWNGAQNQNGNGVTNQFGGPIPVGQLTPQDQAFMAQAGRFMGGGFDPRNIASGGADQVSQLLGGDTYKGMAGFMKNPQQAMQGVSPQVMQAMSQMASQNPELQARWNSLTGGGQPTMGATTGGNMMTNGPTPFGGGATTGGNMAPPTNSPGNIPRFLGPPITPGNVPRFLGPPLQAPGQTPFNPGATAGGNMYTGNQPTTGYQPPWAWGGNNMLPYQNQSG